MDLVASPPKNQEVQIKGAKIISSLALENKKRCSVKCNVGPWKVFFAPTIWIPWLFGEKFQTRFLNLLDFTWSGRLCQIFVDFLENMNFMNAPFVPTPFCLFGYASFNCRVGICKERKKYMWVSTMDKQVWTRKKNFKNIQVAISVAKL